MTVQLDLDAELSGSEASSDEPSSDEETESDRLFAGEDFAPTQAPRGYNQHAAYMAGMSTQAAGRNGMSFRSRYDTEGFLAKARKPVLVSDEERTDGAETDDNEYEMGSFVCDDEDISFESECFPLGSLLFVHLFVWMARADRQLKRIQTHWTRNIDRETATKRTMAMARSFLVVSSLYQRSCILMLMHAVSVSSTCLRSRHILYMHPKATEGIKTINMTHHQKTSCGQISLPPRPFPAFYFSTLLLSVLVHWPLYTPPRTTP